MNKATLQKHSIKNFNRNVSFDKWLEPNKYYFNNEEFVTYFKNNFDYSNISMKDLDNLVFPESKSQLILGWWMDTYTELSSNFIELAEKVTNFIKDNIEYVYNKQMEVVKNIESKYLLGNSIFSSIAVNKNYGAGTHKDGGNLENTIGILLSIKEDINSGNLNLDDYQVSIRQEDGTLIAIDGINNYHGVTKLNKDAKRYSLLFCVNSKVSDGYR